MIKNDSDVQEGLRGILLVHSGKLCALLEEADLLSKKTEDQEEKGRLYQRVEELTTRIEKIHVDIDALSK